MIQKASFVSTQEAVVFIRIVATPFKLIFITPGLDSGIINGMIRLSKFFSLFCANIRSKTGSLIDLMRPGESRDRKKLD